MLLNTRLFSRIQNFFHSIDVRIRISCTSVRSSVDRIPLPAWASSSVLVYVIALGCLDVNARDLSTQVAQQYAIGLDSVPQVPHPRMVIYGTVRIARSSPDIALTYPQGLAVDAHRNIYVADWLMNSVPVINGRGNLIRSIGGQGSGPGEFRNIEDVEILNGGNLLVYDPQMWRITIYFPDSDSVMKTISVPPGPRTTFLTTIRGVIESADPIMVGVYVMANSPQNYTDRIRTDIVRTVSVEGTIIDSIVAFPHKENLMLAAGGGFSVRTNPFGRRGVIHTHADRIYYGWTDTVGVRIYSLHGEFTGGFKVPYERAPVTSHDADQAVKDLDDDEAYLREVLRAHVPKTWPAFETFVVDDRGRVWFGIVGEGGETARWDGFTPGGEYVGSLKFPPNFDLMVVLGDRAYGVRTNDRNVPRIEIYRIDWSDATEESAS